MARPRASADVGARMPSRTKPRAQETPKRPGELSAGLEAILGPSATPQRPRKYRNQPVEIDGRRFDSKREAERYRSLQDDEQHGRIRDLEAHPRFPLVVHGQDCGYYEADFQYVDAKTGERVIEDVKSPSTRKLPAYRLKRKLVWALYGLRIREIE